jgi:ParB-like chromosome segregation protein Spo0J
VPEQLKRAEGCPQRLTGDTRVIADTSVADYGLLQQLLGTKVEIKSNAKNRGSVKIHFYSLDDFDRLLVFFKKAGL